MEPEQISLDVGEKKSFSKLTTLFLKYLTFGLFIALPFIGGWVGYTFAPEKMVETSQEIEEKQQKDNLVSQPNENLDLAGCFDVYDDILEVGSKDLDSKISSAERQVGDCVYKIAKNTKNPNLCAFIDTSIFSEFYRLKDTCYQEIAEIIGDESVCAFLSENASIYLPICKISPKETTSQILDGLVVETNVDKIAEWITSKYFVDLKGIEFDYPNGWKTGNGDTDNRGSFWFYSDDIAGKPKVVINYGDVNHYGYREDYIYVGRVYLSGLETTAYVYTYKKQKVDTIVFWVDVGNIKAIEFFNINELGLDFVEEVISRFRVVYN